MKLFLCSHFSSVGSLIKEEIENKKVAFIPTASLREGYTGYVGSARKLFKKLGAIVTEIDISTEAYSTIQSVFEEADVIYFTGGNSFFLMDQLRHRGLCPAPFLSGLFDCQPEPMKVKPDFILVHSHITLYHCTFRVEL